MRNNSQQSHTINELTSLKNELMNSDLKTESKDLLSSLVETACWLHLGFSNLQNILSLKNQLSSSINRFNQANQNSEEVLFKKNTKLLEMVMSGLFMR